MPVRTVIAFLLLMVVCVPQLAFACVMYTPSRIEDIRHAETVFSGMLVRYELVSPGRPNSLQEYALLTVRVDKVFKGEASGDVQLYWWNSTFGVPRTMERPEHVIIAAVSSESKQPPLRGPSAAVIASRRPDLLQVMQAPCSDAFILPFSQERADDIAAILSGERVRPQN